MGWRPARSLTVFHAQVKGNTSAAPPATAVSAWGLVNDDRHNEDSDHFPHNFPGWGNGIVCAADFPNAPALGLDAWKTLDGIRRSRDPRVKYGISNGQMFSSYAAHGYAAYVWRPYNPANGDRHFTHGHLSVVGDARADGTQPWNIGGSSMSDFTATDRAELQRIGTRVTSMFYFTPTNQWLGNNEGSAFYTFLKAMSDKVDLIAGKVDVDAAELAAIEAAAKKGAGEAFAAQRAAFIAAIVAALPQDRDGNLTLADVEVAAGKAIRAAFGDAATPDVAPPAAPTTPEVPAK